MYCRLSTVVPDLREVCIVCASNTALSACVQRAHQPAFFLSFVLPMLYDKIVNCVFSTEKCVHFTHRADQYLDHVDVISVVTVLYVCTVSVWYRSILVKYLDHRLLHLSLWSCGQSHSLYCSTNPTGKTRGTARRPYGSTSRNAIVDHADHLDQSSMLSSLKRKF